MKTLQLAIAFLVFILAGCASHQSQIEIVDQAATQQDDPPPALNFNAALFGERPEIIPVENIYRLSQQQQADFMHYFEDPAQQVL